MKHNTALFISVLTISTIFCSSVNAAVCHYGDQTIALGDDITFQDPFLVKKASQYYVSKGATMDDALEMAQNSDWTHLVLECMYTYSKAENSDDSVPFGMVTLSEPVLVPLSHQVEWALELMQER